MNINIEFCRAAAENDIIKAIQLLAEGADVNGIFEDKDYTSYGWTPLHMAVFEGHFKMAEFLIKNNAEIDPRTPEYFATPLCLAAHHLTSGMKMIMLLIENGADVNHKSTFNGFVPLLAAADLGSTANIITLLHYGADKNAISADGKTCRMILEQNLNKFLNDNEL